MVTGAQQSNGMSSGALLTYLLIGSLMFGFGYARAVWVRARADYQGAKKAVPVLRKTMWSSIVTAIKLGAFVVIAGLLLVAWVVHDTRHRNDAPKPAATLLSPSPSPHRGHPASTRPR